MILKSNVLIKILFQRLTIIFFNPKLNCKKDEQPV